MKLRQLFENQSQFLQTREKIEEWLQRMKIKNYTIRDDLMVNVDGDVDISYEGLSFIPVQFWEVSENFYCFRNQLESLKGTPLVVGRNFDCANNVLTSLNGAPREVGQNFYCANNRLVSLKGAPKYAGGSFDCSNNLLTSLNGAPKEVSWDFHCDNNRLETLKGAPQEVGGDFKCRNNPQLQSLDGIGEIDGEIYSDL